MRKLRINILTPIPFWHPGTLEYINLLKERGHEVVALDIWDFYYFDEKGDVSYLCPKFLKGVFLRVYRKLNRKRLLRSYIHRDDIVDIQWCGYYYAEYVDYIFKLNEKIIATPFGSDVLRANDNERKIQKHIFDKSKLIVLGKNWHDVFLSFFPDTESKLRFSQFGSARFDRIIELYSESFKLALRLKYKIPDDKICVTVGYSASPVQQHLVFLEQIKKYKAEIASKVVFLFPLTYGIEKKSDYYKKIIAEIKSSGFDYLLFENRLSDEEICEIRILSDIMVNIQTTDSQASSIKEAFAARNVVLVGDWLPYDFYTDEGVEIIKVSIDSLSESFVRVLNDFPSIRQLSIENFKNVTRFASWTYIIPVFLNNYLELENGRN
jgi:hypothetical protein